MNNEQNINNMKERINNQNQANPDVQNMQNLQNNMANMNLNNNPQNNIQSYVNSMPQDNSFAFPNNQKDNSTIFDPKPLDGSNGMIPTIENNNDSLKPPSIKALDLSNNNQNSYIEISKEIITDKHLEIDDDVNPITSDLNQVSAKVKSINKNETQNDINQKFKNSVFYRDPIDSEMYHNYIGKNSGKLLNRIINFSALIFGPLYYAYRKMYLIGMILFVGFLLVTYFIHDLYISLGYIILIGLLFVPLYKIKVKSNVNKIKEKYKGVDTLSLNQMCINKGGTSKFRAMFALLSELIIVYALIVFAIPKQFIDFASEYGVYAEINNYIMKVSFDSDKITEKLNEQGIFISKEDKSFIVNDYFEIGELPKKFKLNTEKSNESLIQYEVNDFSGINRCRFDLKAVIGYNTKEELINSLKKIYKGSVNNKTVNDIDWTYISSEVSLFRHYFYVTNIEDKIVVLSFRTTKNSLKDCNQAEKNILNIIKRK